MKSQSARKTAAVISEGMLESLIVKRQTRDALRKRIELLDTSLEVVEKEIIALLDSGAKAPAGFEVEVRVTERRYPSWKSHFAEVAGAEEAERVLNETAPTISKSLIVR